MTENQLQQQIVIWFNNHYCLKNMNPRALIFAIPNGGSRHILEAKTLKLTGVLSGVSDLIVIMPNSKILFIELKTEKGIQSESQKDFEARITNLHHEYHVIRSLEEFKKLIYENNPL